MKTRMSRLVATTVIALAVLPALTAPPAFAHASELESSPAADEVLTSAPEEVRIDFDSALLEAGSALLVRDETGESITTGAAVIDGSTYSVPVDAAAPEGVYTVAYRVVSADGHTVEGDFSYTVGTATEGAAVDAAAAASEADQAPWLPFALFGGIGLVVILGIGGALLFRK